MQNSIHALKPSFLKLNFSKTDLDIRAFLLTGFLLITLNACTDQKAADKKPDSSQLKPTQISVAKVVTQNLALFEESVGTLEGVIDPTVAAEISARVLKVLVHPGQTVKKNETIALLDGSDFGFQRQEAQSEVGRIEALLANQNKVVERNRILVGKNFISKNALDDVSAQQNALKQQLAGAKSRINTINHNGAKNRVVSPADGIVEKQLVATGDYVRVGDPIVQIISTKLLRAHIPFPEHIAAKLKPGLVIMLTTPTSPKEVRSIINALKPQIVANSRSIDVIADVRDEANWQPGASVTGRIILGENVGALTVPEQSVVLRPAGEVVYQVLNNEAVQRVVKTGAVQNGNIEILEGLKGNETIAVDGAAFLTDKAGVSVINLNDNSKLKKVKP